MELQDLDFQLTTQLLGDIFFFADILVFQQAECCGFMGVPPIPRYQYSPQQINLPRAVLVSCCYTKLVMKILSFWVYTLEKIYGRIFQWFISKEENCAIWASESMKHNEKRE